jgi:hypothetical protein
MFDGSSHAHAASTRPGFLVELFDYRFDRFHRIAHLQAVSFMAFSLEMVSFRDFSQK